jgi:hypothetical protein
MRAPFDVRRERMRAARAFIAWRDATDRAQRHRRTLSQHAAAAASRKQRWCLAAWRDWTATRRARAALLHSVVLRRLRALLPAWRAAAAARAAHAVQGARARAHRRRALLLAALAHWRYRHVALSVARVWEAALARRRELLLLGRAMRVWHFYARRCRQLIAQLAPGRRAGGGGSPGRTGARRNAVARHAALCSPLRTKLVRMKGPPPPVPRDTLRSLRSYPPPPPSQTAPRLPPPTVRLPPPTVQRRSRRRRRRWASARCRASSTPCSTPLGASWPTCCLS